MGYLLSLVKERNLRLEQKINAITQVRRMVPDTILEVHLRGWWGILLAWRDWINWSCLKRCTKWWGLQTKKFVLAERYQTRVRDLRLNCQKIFYFNPRLWIWNRLPGRNSNHILKIPRWMLVEWTLGRQAANQEMWQQF